MTPAGPGNRLLPLDGGTSFKDPDKVKNPCSVIYPVTLTGDRFVAGTVSGEELFEAEGLCSDGDVDGILNTKFSSSVPLGFVVVFSVFTEGDSIGSF